MLFLVAWLACRSESLPVRESDTAASSDTSGVTLSPPVELSLLTGDNVTLEGDYYEVWGGPVGAVCLLHMIPPANDRTNWPAEFIADLGQAGWSVLNIDRRGAGSSGGSARDAYEGPLGWLDVEACTRELIARGHDQFAIVGASNGTTSMVDYFASAADEGLPQPVGLVFMTGGDYTENQTRMSTLDAVPALFTFSTDERAWSREQEGLHDEWSFIEFENGDHGTRMFEAAPEVSDDIVLFLDGL